MVRDIIDYAQNYSKDISGFEKYKVVYRRKKVLEIIDFYSPKSILEIGCGLEPLFLYLNNGQEVSVIEPSKEFYENAKKLSKENKNVVCINGFFEDVVSDLKDKNYDMIICSGLLHEVVYPEKLLEEITKICDKKTIIHINVPNVYSIHRLLGVEIGVLSDIFEQSEGNKKYQQNTNFDMIKLKSMVENNGMKVIDEGGYFIKPFSHRQMEMMLKKQIINEDVLEGLYNLTKYMPQFGSEIFVNCKVED